jgi:hypothetical protein
MHPKEAKMFLGSKSFEGGPKRESALLLVHFVTARSTRTYSENLRNPEFFNNKIPVPILLLVRQNSIDLLK